MQRDMARAAGAEIAKFILEGKKAVKPASLPAVIPQVPVIVTPDPPVINVDTVAPVIHVETAAPVIHVSAAPPAIHVDTVPTVNVQAPIVNVEAPVVNVDMSGLTDAVIANSKQISAIFGQIKAQSESLNNLVKIMAAPKTLVMEDGKPIGVRVNQ